MSDNQRKLLPYEHQLIEALGIDKEEYLAFVAQQHIYEDPKAGTILDARNWDVVAIVLTVIGILFQVVAVLLAPKPQAPREGQPTTRDEIFAPRFGFNSAQNLARHGDIVNLVYANANDNPQGGGVRVATSLLWSVMQSYGGSQLVQLLLLMGGGSIGAIDPSRSAFGQTPFRDLLSQNYWLYFRPNGTGFLRNNDVLPDLYGGPSLTDPTRFGSDNDNPFRIRQIGAGSKLEGFSHAYSPASANQFGVYGIVPINVDVIVRDGAGDVQGARNRVRVRLGGTSGTIWGEFNENGGSLALVNTGTQCYIQLDGINSQGDSLGELEAKESRRALASVFDNAGVFKLGSIPLKLQSIDNPNIEQRHLEARAQAIAPGAAPSIVYAIAQEQGKDGFARPIPGQVNFSVKALARIEEASYETVSPCNIVDFSIKARVFRRISGRQSEYGSKNQPGYAVSDNGITHRSAMFLLKYKTSNENAYRYFPGILVIRRAADIDNYVMLRFATGTTGEAAAKHWQFKFEPVVDPLSEFAAHPELTENNQRLYYYLENTGNLAAKALPNGARLEYTGFAARGGLGDFPPLNSGPVSREWDLFSPMSDTQYQFSFDQGPEMTIAAVTEQIVEPFSRFARLYQNLSLLGLTMYSGKTVQDLRSLTVAVTLGRPTRSLRTSGNGWGSDSFDYLSATPDSHAANAPDIFVDTILSKDDGIGNYASLYSTNLKQLAISKKFCLTNDLFMEGVIADAVPWRQFWATNAGFSLLELARIGGQDVLVPAVPYNRNTGALSSSIAISALFNQGNILEDSYKEEFIDYGSNSQDVIVRVIFRKLDSGGVFALNDSVTVSLADTIQDYATEETIDASAFVSRRDQAILIGKLLCLSKRHSRRAIEFKTFPTDSPVFPGAYIYIELAHNSWDRIYSGIVEEYGVLNTPSSIADGSYVALTYRHGANASLDEPTGTKYYSNVSITTTNDGRKVAAELAGDQGSLFVLGHEIRRKRVFRATEVSMDEEGEVTIRAVEHATDNQGQSLIGLGMISNAASLWRIA